MADGWIRIEADGCPDDLMSRLETFSKDEAMARLSSLDVPAVPARRGVDLANDADLVAYGVLHHDPRQGREHWWTAGRHVHFSRTPRQGTLVAPALGEHTREVLTEARVAPERVEELTRAR